MAVEKDPIHAETYEKNFPQVHVVTGDVEALHGRDLIREAPTLAKGVDVVVGGPPCQGFSVGGKRLQDDPRRAMLGEFARVVVELEPRYFVIENVLGLATYWPFIRDAISTLRSAGYEVVDPIEMLDASRFGVPQRRRRIFILGYRRGEAAPIYPTANPAPTVTVNDAIGDIPPDLTDGRDEIDASSLLPASVYASALRKTRPGFAPHSVVTGVRISSHGAAVIDRFAATNPGEYEPVSRYYRLDPAGLCPTLRAGTGSEGGSYTAPRPIHPTQNRCVTVREAARLQSFPDWFNFHRTTWHGFRQIGNSVPPLLAAAVARSILIAATTESADVA